MKVRLEASRRQIAASLSRAYSELKTVGSTGEGRGVVRVGVAGKVANPDVGCGADVEEAVAGGRARGPEGPGRELGVVSALEHPEEIKSVQAKITKWKALPRV